MPRLLRALFVVAVLLVAIQVTACANDTVSYVDDGTAYDKESALALLEQEPPSGLAQEPTAKSGQLRTAALTQLRRQGEAESEAASFITRTLPAESRSVPFRVERGSYEGVPALLILEATGPRSGTLSDVRVWILAENGEVLLVANR